MLHFIARFRRFFLFAGLFSLVIKLLLIVPAVYMLQVFDRVMTSRSQETLVMLTVFTVVALVVMAALDFVRSQLLARGAVALDRTLGPIVLREMLAGRSRPTPDDAQHALRDVSILRTFLAGAPILALFDIPWIPVYIVVISLFHPLLGLVALAGAVILLILTIINERLSRGPLEAMQSQSRQASQFVDLSLRNAESIAAMGMAPGVLASWETHHHQVLNRYLDDGRLEIDNNAIERAIRPVAQGRANWLFVASKRGGHAAAALYSLIESAKANGHNPYAYLRDVLTRLAVTKAKDIDSLLPHVWQPQA